MNTSATLAKLGPALADAHKAMPPLVKDATNPHFKSRYLSLDGLLGAVRGPLLAHGILIVQSASQSDDSGIGVVTRLQHTSGEFIEGTVRVPLEKPTPQAAGSALSYGRRYGLEAILGLTGSDDDDANTAEVHQVNVPAKRPGPVVTSAPAPTAPRTHTEHSPSGPVTVPACPVCNGRMWDNREGKKNPKAPDFKCRDKSCDGVIWPPKQGTMPVGVVAGPAFDEVPEGLLDIEDPTMPF